VKAETLLTPRCILRPPAEDDVSAIVALTIDPAVRRFLGGPSSMERALARAENLIAGERPHTWAVFLNDGPRSCIGLVGIHLHHDGVECELSYEFLPAVWGAGISSEAVSAVLDHAFNNLGYARLISETQAGNQPSRRFLERLGMHWERELTRFGATQAIYAIEKASC
jgi:ribosomal-protein-alanine N-acetyltransferase